MMKETDIITRPFLMINRLQLKLKKKISRNISYKKKKVSNSAEVQKGACRKLILKAVDHALL